MKHPPSLLANRRKRRFVTIALFGAATLCLAIAHNAYAVTPVDWETPSTGALAGIQLTMTGLSSPVLQVNPPRSFSGPDYSAAPLTGAESVQYGASNSWTITFEMALPDLLLYAGFWRGEYTSGADPTTNYTFSQPFVVLSGFAGAIVVGNTLSLPDGQFYDGIVGFVGPITSLSVASDGFAEFGQDMTFASTIPEPSSAVLALTGLATFLAMRRWLKRRSVVCDCTGRA